MKLTNLIFWLVVASVQVFFCSGTAEGKFRNNTAPESSEKLANGKPTNPCFKKQGISLVTESENTPPRDRATLVLEEWMRDPFITLGPDNYYYLSCTRLWHSSHKKSGLEIRRSKDLLNWEEQGQIWTFDDSNWMPDALTKAAREIKKDPQLWAPIICITVQLTVLRDRTVNVNLPDAFLAMEIFLRISRANGGAQPF